MKNSFSSYLKRGWWFILLAGVHGASNGSFLAGIAFGVVIIFIYFLYKEKMSSVKNIDKIPQEKEQKELNHKVSKILNEAEYDSEISESDKKKLIDDTVDIIKEVREGYRLLNIINNLEKNLLTEIDQIEKNRLDSNLEIGSLKDEIVNSHDSSSLFQDKNTKKYYIRQAANLNEQFKMNEDEKDFLQEFVNLLMTMAKLKSDALINEYINFATTNDDLETSDFISIKNLKNRFTKDKEIIINYISHDLLILYYFYFVVLNLESKILEKDYPKLDPEMLGVLGSLMVEKPSFITNKFLIDDIEKKDKADLKKKVGAYSKNYSLYKKLGPDNWPIIAKLFSENICSKNRDFDNDFFSQYLIDGNFNIEEDKKMVYEIYKTAFLKTRK